MKYKQARNEMDRREAIKLGLLGVAGLSLGGLEGSGKAWAQATPPPKGAKAKSVIQVWMWGGPSHLDTFDPKPQAGYEYCGPLDRPIGTNIAGIQIGQLLPELAKHADKYSLIRSMSHGINAHETASYMVQTGHPVGRLVYPCIGAVISKLKGYECGYRGIIPPYIVLTQPQGRFSEAGFLGPKYKPFSTGGDPAKNPFVVEGIVAQGISDERQKKRRELLHRLDTLGQALPESPEFARLDTCEKNAYGMMFGDSRELFDLSLENEATRDCYGTTTFGQSCLMARRLVEHGVPYITINYKGWDTHKQHFGIMNRKLPEFDKGLAALLEDLSARGLLESTIVWVCGEFGRGPKIKWEAPWNGGRSHHGACFSALVAGGGFKGGHVVGASDAKGVEVDRRSVHPQELVASLYELLGIDAEGELSNSRGLKVKVMPTPEGGLGRLREIM